MTNTDSNVCVISLTYNRLKYIKRSFESLRNRAGVKFDHYVFDDGSDQETVEYLKSQEKYFAGLHFRDSNVNVAENFYQALKQIPKNYEYYLKFDSDIEVLSDDLLSGLIDVSDLPNVGCVVPRVEGISRTESSDGDLNFYKNHSVRIKSAIHHGCCVLVPKRAILNYIQMVEEQPDADKWGADTKLYKSALQNEQLLLFVEDLSAYHIDNTAGQRKDWKYFKDRKRWNKVDDTYVDYLRASKDISPSFVERVIMDQLYMLSDNDYEKFLKILLDYVKNPQKYEVVRKKSRVRRMKTSYRITSPFNYPVDSHIKHGSVVLVDKIPEWAKNNMLVVVEPVELELWEIPM